MTGSTRRRRRSPASLVTMVVLLVGHPQVSLCWSQTLAWSLTNTDLFQPTLSLRPEEVLHWRPTWLPDALKHCVKAHWILNWVSESSKSYGPDQPHPPPGSCTMLPCRIDRLHRQCWAGVPLRTSRRRSVKSDLCSTASTARRHLPLRRQKCRTNTAGFPRDGVSAAQIIRSLSMTILKRF